MELKNGVWVVVARPQINIVSSENSSIPFDVVDGVDQL